LKIAVTSDWHGYLLPEEWIPDVDLIIIAGDIGLGETFSYAPEVLLTDWYDFLKKCPPVVAVAGNHDFEKEVEIFRHMPWTYLEDEAVEIDGVKIWGSPWSNPFGYGWAFNMPEDEQVELFKQIPDDTHVIISHGPPYRSGDLTAGWRDQPPQHVGSVALLDRMYELDNLQLVATGHIHSAYGAFDIPGKSKTCTVVNGSLVNEEYKITNPPIIVEVEA
jgi:Icc-related predicted phosphoesterase